MPTAEDWMWLQLVLAREMDRATDPAHEVFTLQDLQKGVIQFGAKHFGTKGSNVGLYFQMLLMSGLFEDVSPPQCCPLIHKHCRLTML
jgi:nuclear pore complex protein Nup93